jgi:hypothetical protein
MSQRDKALAFFVVLGILIELGLFVVFIDLSMRGRATTLWMFAVWPFLIFPFLAGWMYFARNWTRVTWLLFLVATGYSTWYQLTTYGWSLCNRSIWVVGFGHILIVGLLVWSLLWYLRQKDELPHEINS